MRSLLFISLLSVFACTSNEKVQTTTETKTFEIPPSGYVRMEGTIGNAQTQINALITKDGIRGSYTQGEGRLIHLYSFNYQPSTDSIQILSNFYQPPSSELPQEDTFRLVYSNDQFNGVYYPYKGTPQPVVWKQSFPAGSVKLETATIRDSMVLKEGPAAYLLLEYFVPGKNLSQPLKDSLNSWLVSGGMNDLQNREKEMDVVAKRFTKEYLDKYERDLNGMIEVSENDEDFTSPVFQYNHTRSMYVLYNQNDLLVFSTYIYDYSGGAHPNHVTKITCVDIKEGKILKWDDVFSVEPLAMRSLMEKHFRKVRGMKPEEPLKNILFEDYLEPNSNFYITHGGIGFWYVPYEIAAYAYGDTELFIPMEELLPFLTEKFKIRMGKTPS